MPYTFEDGTPIPDLGDYRLEPEKKKGFVSDVSRGVDNLQATLYGLTSMAGGALNLPSVENWGMEGYKRNQEEAQANPPEIGTYKNINGVGDALKYGREAIGENLPMMIPSLVSGGVGATVARKLAEKAVAEQVGKKMAEEEAKRLIARRTLTGGALGAYPPAAGLEAGSIYGDIYDQTGEKRPGVAAGYGALAGILDVAPELMLFNKALLPAKGGMRELGKTVGKQFGAEAGTEAAQTMIEKAALKHVDPSKDVFSKGNIDEMIDSALKGGIAGGGLGAGAHVMSPRDKALSDTANLVMQQRDLKTQAEQDVQTAKQEAQAEKDALKESQSAKPDPVSAVQSMEGKPADIFSRPSILDTVNQAAPVLDEIAAKTNPEVAPVVEAPPADTRPNVKAALGELDADPAQILESALAKPGVENTIAQASNELEQVAQQRAEYPRELEALNALKDAKPVTTEDASFLTANKLAIQRPNGVQLLPAGRRRLKELSALDKQAHEAATSPENARPEPTPAQQDANNYKLGHVKVSGLDISVENPEGSVRRSKPGAAVSWETTMQDHYGYVKGVPAKGADKDHVDVFVKAGTPDDFNGNVYVIDQNNHDGSFDESKTMVGYASREEATKAYLRNYQKGWESRVRGVTEMPIDQFKAKLQDESAFLKPQETASEQKPISTATEAPQQPEQAKGEASQTPAATAQAAGQVEPWTQTREAYIEQSRKDQSVAADEAIREAEKLPDDWKNGIWNKGNYVAQVKQRYADRSADNLLDVQSYQRAHEAAVKRAVAAGEDVSAQVLADYPTLAKQQKAQKRKDKSKQKTTATPDQVEDQTLANDIANEIRTPEFDKLTPDEQSSEIEAALGPADEVQSPQSGETKTGAGDGAPQAESTSKPASTTDSGAADTAATPGNAEPVNDTGSGARKDQVVPERSARGDAKAPDLSVGVADENGRKPRGPSAADQGSGVNETPAETKLHPAARSRESSRPAEPDVRQPDPTADTTGDQPDTNAEPASQEQVATPSAAELGIQEVRDWIDPVLAKWKNAPPVEVINDISDAPAGVLDTEAKQSKAGAKGTPDAFFYDGKVYLVANVIGERQRAITALMHESLGHFGLNGVYGDGLKNILGQVAKSRPADIQAKAEQYGLDIKNEKQRLIAAEEVLADLAQSHPQLGFVKRTISAIRQFLRDIGVNVKLSDDDIIANFILPARQFVERGKANGEPQAEVTMHRAFHGSPHDFEQFSLHKIGTGEGAQAYGWGLYFAGKREVAEHYKRALSMDDPNALQRHALEQGLSPELADTMAQYYASSKTKDYAGLKETVDQKSPNEYIEKFRDKYIRPAIADGSAERVFNSFRKAGRLYEVELAPKESEYLDWDKPLSEQSDSVKQALQPYIDKWLANVDNPELDVANRTMASWAKRINDGTLTGEQIYRAVGGGSRDGAQAASEALAKAGVPGIRYLDGSSRNAIQIEQSLKRTADGVRHWLGYRNGDLVAQFNTRAEAEKWQAAQQNHNYVIFDDKHVKVEAKFSRQPDWVKNGSPELQSAAGKVDTYSPDKTIQQKVNGLKADWQKRLVQGLVDQFGPLKELSYKAYVLARMTKSADGVLEGTLLYGKPKMDADGAIIGDLDGKGFLGAMQELQGEHDRFMLWVAGNRSERLMGEGREHLFTPDEIKAMKKLNQGNMTDGTSRVQAYQKAQDVFKDYNTAVMDIAEKTGLIDGAARSIYEHDFYVPYYRLMEDDKISGPAKVKGLVRQQAFKKLKGGQEPLGDLLQNTLANWSHLISASLDNQAAVASLNAAEQAGVASKVRSDTKNATYAMVNGKQVHYTVDDPFVMTAISAMSAPDFKGPAMQVMRKFKRVLTLGVTASPSFRIRNLMRDTIAAIGQNPISYNIFKNVAQGYKGTHRGNADYAQLLFGGGMMRFGTYLEGDRAEHVKRLINEGVDDQTILDTPAKVKAALGKWWDVYQEFGDRMENINRSALYKQLIAQGKTHQEASYRARDMMDFSNSGSFQAIRILTQIVPFLGARAQGLYKMGRGFKEDPRRLGYVAGAVALTSMGLLLAYQDDEEWKKRADWDRDQFWWFRIGDTAFRIPKPFEFGALGTVAERGLELMIDDEMTGKRFAERMQYMIGQTFSMNPTPQLFKPMIDIYANQDSFTNRQIETRGMENLSKSERMNANTSLVAQTLGSAGDVTGLSPVQLDFLTRAYFGWLGTHISMTIDLMAEPFSENEKPTRRLGDLFVIGDFAKELPQDQSRYVDQFYKQAKQVSEVMSDIRHARETQDLDKAVKLVAENKDKVMSSKLYTQAEAHLSKVNKAIRITTQNKELSADAKRTELDRLIAERNTYAEAVSKKADEIRQSQ